MNIALRNFDIIRIFFREQEDTPLKTFFESIMGHHKINECSVCLQVFSNATDYKNIELLKKASIRSLEYGSNQQQEESIIAPLANSCPASSNEDEISLNNEDIVSTCQNICKFF